LTEKIDEQLESTLRRAMSDVSAIPTFGQVIERSQPKKSRSKVGWLLVPLALVTVIASVRVIARRNDQTIVVSAPKAAAGSETSATEAVTTSSSPIVPSSTDRPQSGPLILTFTKVGTTATVHMTNANSYEVQYNIPFTVWEEGPSGWTYLGYLYDGQYVAGPIDIPLGGAALALEPKTSKDFAYVFSHNDQRRLRIDVLCLPLDQPGRRAGSESTASAVYP
jgi:hypothetical protein